MKRMVITLALASSLFGFAGRAAAVDIDNDVPVGTVGHWLVDVTTGGESRLANITANRFASGDVFTEQVLFDYFSYVDPGNDGAALRLSGSAPVVDSEDEDSISSFGSFIGANGNSIDWTVTSSIPDGVSVMTSVFTFTAQTGTLGVLRFLQYMDEDVESTSDDVFFTRGSSAAADLELFTVDNSEVYGVSHSGALSASFGLVDASFAGFAADTYNNIKPRISPGTGQNVSLTGTIANLPSFDHPVGLRRNER